MLKEIKARVNCNNKLTEKQKVELVERYQNGEIASKLAKEFTITYSSVIGLLKRRDIVIINRGYRKNTFDYHFFDEINNEEKAYLLGFLYADGCNYINYTKRMHTISLEISHKDVEILDFLKKCLKYNGKNFYFRTRKPSFIGSQKIVSGEVCSIRLSNKHMSERLNKIGMFPKKSLILKFPNSKILPKHLMRHFIRGYFDGDGGYSLNKKGNLFWSITSSDIFCKEISIITNKLFGIEVNPSKRGRVSRLTIGGNKNVIKISDWMYGNSNIFLKRKYDKFTNFLKIYKDKNFKMDNNQTKEIDRNYYFDKYLI